MSDVTVEQVQHLIEQLPPDQIEQLRTWLNTPQESRHPTWGESLVALVKAFPLEEADKMAIDDPETWVREHRRTKTSRRNPGWGEE